MKLDELNWYTVGNDHVLSDIITVPHLDTRFFLLKATHPVTGAVRYDVLEAGVDHVHDVYELHEHTVVKLLEMYFTPPTPGEGRYHAAE